MAKIYTKTHDDKKALLAHAKKIEKRGGAVRIKGNTIEYGFMPQSKDTEVTATAGTELIKEAAQKGYHKIKVVFVPPYDEKLHSGLGLKKGFIDHLKKSKVSVFNLQDAEDYLNISDLIKTRKDVLSINYTK